MLTNTRGPHKESKSDTDARKKRSNLYACTLVLIILIYAPSNPQMNISNTHLGANMKSSCMLQSDILMGDDVFV